MTRATEDAARAILATVAAIYASQGWREGLTQPDGAPTWIGPRLAQIEDAARALLPAEPPKPAPRSCICTGNECCDACAAQRPTAYMIRCSTSGGVTGYREAWLQSNGVPAVFETREAAAAKLPESRVLSTGAALSYWIVKVARADQ